MAPDLEPEHPHNIYLHMLVSDDIEQLDLIRDALLEKSLQRAREIKKEAQQSRTRIYTCCFKHKDKEMGYFLINGFIQIDKTGIAVGRYV